MGYKTEKARKEESLKQCGLIIEKRKAYNLPPLIEPGETKRYNVGCKTISKEEFAKEWPIFIYGRGSLGEPIIWDKSGALTSKFIKKISSNVEDTELASKMHMCDVVEQLHRVKAKISQEKGYRITKHIGVIDASQVGLSTISSMNA